MEPNLRQLVVFAILMEQNEGILGKYKRYVFEKFKVCTEAMVPEAILDAPNLAKFTEYARRMRLDWNSGRDYSDMPRERLKTPTGEPMTDAEWEKFLKEASK